MNSSQDVQEEQEGDEVCDEPIEYATGEDATVEEEPAEEQILSEDVVEEPSGEVAKMVGDACNPSGGHVNERNHDPFDDEFVEGEGDLMENLPEENMSYMAPGALSDSSFAEQHGMHHGRQDHDRMPPDYAVAAFDGIIMTPSSGYRSSSAPSVADLVNKFRRMQYVPGTPTAQDGEIRQPNKTDIHAPARSEDEGGLLSSDEEFSFSEVMGSFCLPTGRKSSVGGVPQPYDAF